MNIRFEADGKERIFQQALALCVAQDCDRSRVMLDLVCQQAAAYCG